MLHPFVGLKAINRPGAALQGSGEQACPCGEVDRDGAAIGRCRYAASEGRTLTIPVIGMSGRDQVEHVVPAGPGPDAGSSGNTTSGLLSSGLASATRWRRPLTGSR
jgi:hypothetical protein